LYEGQKEISDIKSQEKKVVDGLVRAFHLYGEGAQTPEELDTYQAMITLLLRPYEDKPEAYTRIQEQWRQRIFGDSKEKKVFNGIARNALEGTITPEAILAPQSSKEQTLQINPETSGLK
jgi:hypothetical protein